MAAYIRFAAMLADARAISGRSFFTFGSSGRNYMVLLFVTSAGNKPGFSYWQMNINTGTAASLISHRLYFKDALMQNCFRYLLVLLILSACGQRHTPNNQNSVSVFKIFLHPSFDEKAQIVLTKNDSQQMMYFLLLGRKSPKQSVDTFYQKTISLTKQQFDNFDSLVIKKAKIKQPNQWTGCCDGMPVEYFTINGDDTLKLYFRSPDIKSDSSGYELTKLAVDKLRVFYNDTIITDYLKDIESYMDESKHHSNWKENRPINKLRKMEYSR